jgi:hypothetical protein
LRPARPVGRRCPRQPRDGPVRRMYLFRTFRARLVPRKAHGKIPKPMYCLMTRPTIKHHAEHGNRAQARREPRCNASTAVPRAPTASQGNTSASAQSANDTSKVPRPGSIKRASASTWSLPRGSRVSGSSFRYTGISVAVALARHALMSPSSAVAVAVAVAASSVPLLPKRAVRDPGQPPTPHPRR